METKIQTRTGIHTKIITFELYAVNERSVKSSLLKQIIEYCVPKQLLSGITLRGQKGNEVYATMNISISYDESNRVYVRVNSSFHNNIDSEEKKQPYQACPVWTQTIDWFCHLCRTNSLYLAWDVSFSRDRQKMWDKFGFVARENPLVYKTTSAVTHKVVNSNDPGLQMATRLSDEILSDNEFVKKQ